MSKCQHCNGVDRGGIRHQWEREVVKFKNKYPGFVPLHEKSATGVALKKRGYQVLEGPGVYVSTIHLAYITYCSWVYGKTLKRWVKREIK